MTRRKKVKIPERSVDEVTALSHEGRGIAHLTGKTIFIRGALPGEAVQFRTIQSRKQYDEGSVIAFTNPNPNRVAPHCQHFDICGGCSMQHLNHAAQIEHKQTVLLEQLQHIGHCQPKEVLPPLLAKQTAYRGKARLGVRFSNKTNSLVIGFREHSSGFFLVDLKNCAVLDERINNLIVPLRDCLNQLSIRDQIPQIEVATSDTEAAFVIRNMQACSETDREQLTLFGKTHQVRILLQPHKPDQLISLWPEGEVTLMEYQIPEFNCRLQFYPTDFTQINADLNRKMISLALHLLDVQQDEHVLELFCGIGNFTLPLARQAKQVTAVEGSASLVARAQQNAELNDLSNIEFQVADLSQDQQKQAWTQQSYAKLLLDPSRAGADEILKHLPHWQPKRIVYVSCNPATMARDANQIIAAGYELTQAGIMDMFPHTGHVESIAVFNRR